MVVCISSSASELSVWEVEIGTEGFAESDVHDSEGIAVLGVVDGGGG